MIFLNFTVNRLVSALLFFVLLAGCRPKVRELKSPPHYNFSTAYTQKLPDTRLLEISGIAWDPKSNFFLAVNDESDRLFFLDKENKIIKEEYKFGDKGDYEDVAILEGRPYILRSDGMITKFVKDSAGKVFGLDVG